MLFGGTRMLPGWQVRDGYRHWASIGLGEAIDRGTEVKVYG